MPRIVLKSTTYCVMHLTVAMIVAYALTRDWRAALAIGIIEPLVQTVFFTVHDRMWAKADKGRAPTVMDGGLVASPV